MIKQAVLMLWESPIATVLASAQVLYEDPFLPDTVLPNWMFVATIFCSDVDKEN